MMGQCALSMTCSRSPGADGWCDVHRPTMQPKPSAVKDTNPKDAVGTKKVPFSVIPQPVIAELGLAMLEGARKYGRHNYRVAGVRESVYLDAAWRHLCSWWEGEDIDPDSGVHHVTKCIATLTVLRDSQIRGNSVDDRPPSVAPGWLIKLNERAGAVIEKYPDAKEAWTQKNAPQDVTTAVCGKNCCGYFCDVPHCGCIHHGNLKSHPGQPRWACCGSLLSVGHAVDCGEVSVAERYDCCGAVIGGGHYTRCEYY